MTPQEQVAQLQRETRSSIELTRNSKGDYQWVVKQYHEGTPESITEAMQSLSRIDAQLRREYLPAE